MYNRYHIDKRVELLSLWLCGYHNKNMPKLCTAIVFEKRPSVAADGLFFIAVYCDAELLFYQFYQ